MPNKILRNIIVRNKILDLLKYRSNLPRNTFSTESKSSSNSNDTNLIKHNFHADCEEGINHQIHQEFCVSYVYLYMSSIFSRFDVALHGFAKYFRYAAGEELEHAQKLIEFLNKRGGQLVLKNVVAPEKKDWSNPLCAVQCSIDLEKQVAESLEALHKRGQKHNDAHLCDFIETYYLAEQYDSIKKLGDLLTNVKRVGPGLGIVMLDLELQKSSSDILFGLHTNKDDLVSESLKSSSS